MEESDSFEASGLSGSGSDEEFDSEEEVFSR
jgi:hypothetical protein